MAGYPLPPAVKGANRMLLLMAQVDDAPGELLGEFMRRVERLGAKNVQLVPTLTKKGRPGYIVFIDTPAELETSVAELLGRELGAWGYRVLETLHRHFDIDQQKVEVSVSVNGTPRRVSLRVKTVSQGGTLLRVKAEHDDLVAACEELRKLGGDMPLMTLKACVESRYAEGLTADAPIEIRV
jgi:uncharacterized protein (DUF111 family)